MIKTFVFLLIASGIGSQVFADVCTPQQLARGCKTTWHNGHEPYALCWCPSGGQVGTSIQYQISCRWINKGYGTVCLQCSDGTLKECHIEYGLHD